MVWRLISFMILEYRKDLFALGLAFGVITAGHDREAFTFADEQHRAHGLDLVDKAVVRIKRGAHVGNWVIRILLAPFLRIESLLELDEGDFLLLRDRREFDLFAAVHHPCDGALGIAADIFDGVRECLFRSELTTRGDGRADQPRVAALDGRGIMVAHDGDRGSLSHG